jgi:uncharacterized protein
MGLFHNDDMTVYFASDIHGSQKCFNKFINAGKFYSADVLVMGGDITGKSILAVEKQNGDIFTSNFMGKTQTFHSVQEAEDFKKTVRTAGFYPYIATSDDWQAYLADSEKMDRLFLDLMKESLEEWLDFAEKKLNGTNIQCFVMPGNDDPAIVTDILKESSRVINPDGCVCPIDENRTLVGCGYSNPTPWDSPRECSEEDLLQKLEKLMQTVKNPSGCILCAHVPPYNSTLDEAPRLSKDLQVQSTGGQVEFAPVGSTAVRDIIEKYQPLLGLHGHIHEVHAVKKLGNTVCINPGSDYGDGTLHGAIVRLAKNKVKTYQLVSG